MKGYIDERGNDRTPCGKCKHNDGTFRHAPCFNCIAIIDLAQHKPNHETEFAAYEPAEEGER